PETALRGALRRLRGPETARGRPETALRGALRRLRGPETARGRPETALRGALRRLRGPETARGRPETALRGALRRLRGPLGGTGGRAPAETRILRLRHVVSAHFLFVFSRGDRPRGLKSHHPTGAGSGARTSTSAVVS